MRDSASSLFPTVVCCFTMLSLMPAACALVPAQGQEGHGSSHRPVPQSRVQRSAAGAEGVACNQWLLPQLRMPFMALASCQCTT